MKMIPISSIETCRRQRSVQGFRTPVVTYVLLDSSKPSPRRGNGAVSQIIAVPNKEGAFYRRRASILGSCSHGATATHTLVCVAVAGGCRHSELI
jgi:hypothetical protein